MGSRKNKILAVVLVLVALMVAVTGTVYAYLSATTGSVENSFTAAPTHAIDIEEVFPTGSTNPVKKDVCVDVGTPGYAVYVRVAIVVTWQKKVTVDGAEQIHVYGQQPVAGTDYSIDLHTGTDDPWFKGNDGFYYLEDMITSGQTSVLISECRQLQSGPEDYMLHVEIIAQTIQAKGSTDADGIPAVESAWKVVKVNPDGTLSKKEN